jgi:large subunit ribosomal protein L21
MYAIVEIAGKQFRVEQNQNIKVPHLTSENGEIVDFDKVLFYSDEKGKTHIGAPLVNGIGVKATILEHGRDDKVIIFKKKRRKGYQKKNGHRQGFSLIKIDSIGKIKKAPAKKAVAEKEQTAAKKELTTGKKEAAKKRPLKRKQ